MPSRCNPDPFAAQLGARIRQLRKEKQMSLQRLAQASGLSRGHLSDIERGKVIMTVGTLGSVAGALEVPAFILCLIPKEDPGVAAMNEVMLLAQGDPKKAAKTIRTLILENGPQQDSQPASAPFAILEPNEEPNLEPNEEPNEEPLETSNMISPT